MRKWSEKDLKILNNNFNKSFLELSVLLNRSEKAIKHKVYQLGLNYKRDDGVLWTGIEKKIIINNSSLNSSELMDLLPGRSRVAIEQMARIVRGTSHRRLKKGWGESSKELAYFLGALCSDGHISKYRFEVCQSQKDSKFVDRVHNIIENKFGLKVKRRMYKKNSQDGKFEYYHYLGVYCKDLFDNFSKNKKFKSISGEWIQNLNGEFSWVFKKPYVWSFLGALYDGDGTRNKSNGSVSIAINPKSTANELLGLLKMLGFDCRYDDVSIVFSASSGRRFLNSIDNELERKKGSFEMEEGVHFIDRDDAVAFLGAYHYLNGVPLGTYIGYVEGGKLIAVAVFGSTMAKVIEGDYRVRELRRFARSDEFTGQSSQLLSRIVKLYLKKNDNIDLIVSFADEAEGHKGILYKAMSWVNIGFTGEELKIIAPDGSELSFRHGVEQLRKKGIVASDCKVKIFPGKHKYVYVCARKENRRKEIKRCILGK